MEYLTNKSIKKDGLIDINDINEKIPFFYIKMVVIPYIKYMFICVQCKICGEPIELSHNVDEMGYNEDNEDNEIICKSCKYTLTITERGII